MKSHESNDKNQETIFNDCYLAKKKISSGSFGVVYFGIDLRTNESVAIKIEKIDGNDDMKSVLKEASILSLLSDVKGVPKLYWAGSKGPVDVMVISLLGKDLTSYLKIFKKFSLKTVVMLGEQLINILESVHNRGVVHRDLKPENILMGKGEYNNQTYLVDFGISKVYRDSNGVHIPYRDKKSFIGTTRYASLSAHDGIEISRKDDLESLLYVLIFLAKGNLPWQNLKVTENEKTRKVGEMKTKMSAEDLCKELPEEFVKFLNYVKNLSFKQNPDYVFLKGLFNKIAENNNFKLDYVWDWGLPIKFENNKIIGNSQKRDSLKPSTNNNNSLIKSKDSRQITPDNKNKMKSNNFNFFPHGNDTSLMLVKDLNNDKTKAKSSSNLGNALDNTSDLLKVPDLNKSGDISNNSSFNLSINNSSVAIKYPSSFLDFDINEYKTEGIFIELTDV
jgi:serine/threonine protein kinase